MRLCLTPPARNHRWPRVPHHNRQETKRRTTLKHRKRRLVTNQNLPFTSRGLCPSPRSNSYFILSIIHTHILITHISILAFTVLVIFLYCMCFVFAVTLCSQYALCMYFMPLCHAHAIVGRRRKVFGCNLRCILS